jgi:MFS family permease
MTRGRATGAVEQTVPVTGRPRPTVVRPLDRAPLRRVVTVLCFTEIVSWGILFYAFPVLATTISGVEGWPLTSLVAVFTVAQLVAAAAGLWVGRRLDRRGPRLLMTVGSAVGVASVVAIAVAPSLATYALAWVVAGLAMSATLYPPAFATVTHWAGPGRVQALTAVTLVAGFASTVFAPLTALLVDHLSWRQTYLVLAVVLCTTIPAHWWGLRASWAVEARPSSGDEAGSHQPASDRRPPTPTRRPEFLLLTAALTLAGFSLYAVVINLVPLLTQNGLSTADAAVALGVGGAGQVAGRLLYGPVLARLPVRARTVATLLAASLTTAALGTAHEPLVLVCAISFAAGSARGIFTLIQATAVSDRWGTAAYGARSSVLSGSVTAAAALSPWACAALAAALGSYEATFLVLAAAAAVSALLVPGQPKRPEM